MMINGGGRDRTADARLMSPLLYQLSYPASIEFSKFNSSPLLAKRKKRAGHILP